MKGAVALITGATDGVGNATARCLVEQGWTVVITGRSRARCEATVAELRGLAPAAEASALVGDLSSMGEVRRLAAEFLASHARLDLLVLNANSITQQHARTRDGFEANLAIGYLGRVLLLWALEGVLRRTPGAQVLTVVGLNLERLDLDDPSTATGFSSMKALGRWQWAMQVFAREWNRRVPEVAMNVYMPGLVRTKILANEPQPMRLVVQLANFFIGIPVERSGAEVAAVVRDVQQHARRDAYFARTKLRPPRKLRERPDDGARLWALTERMLEPWRRVG